MGRTVELQNAQGRPVDAVPFLVISLLGFTASLSFGPGYLMAYGLSLPASVGGSLVGFLVILVFAYRRYVWNHRPELRSEVPADARLRRFFYGTLIFVGILVVLTMPLIVRQG